MEGGQLLGMHSCAVMSYVHRYQSERWTHKTAAAAAAAESASLCVMQLAPSQTLPVRVTQPASH